MDKLPSRRANALPVKALPGRPSRIQRGPADKPMRREEFLWGLAYDGTRQQLVDAGILADEAFPEKGVVRMIIDGRQTRIERSSKHRFRVRISWTEAEAAAARSRWKFSQEMLQVRERIESLPETHDAYRKKCESMLDHLEYFEYWLSRPAGGFRFDDDTLDQVGVLIQGIRGALAEGRTRFNQAARAEQVARLRAQARGKDPGFEGFMGRLGAGS